MTQFLLNTSPAASTAHKIKKTQQLANACIFSSRIELPAGCGDHEARIVCAVLRDSQTIKVLDFSNNYLSDAGAALLSDLILGKPCVRELYLYNCWSLGAVGEDALRRANASLHEQCEGSRPHSMLLWSVDNFGRVSQPEDWFHTYLRPAVVLPHELDAWFRQQQPAIV